MRSAKLLNKVSGELIEFEFMDFRLEKGYYLFEIGEGLCKIVPSYDFILDITYELKNI